jgi:uncharacterized integral membrane protein
MAGASPHDCVPAALFAIGDPMSLMRRCSSVLIGVIFAIARVPPRASGYDQASVSTPARAQPSQPSTRRSRREIARTTALIVLAVLITLFAVLNVKEVKVNWIFGSSYAPLIVVIVVSLLVGILLTHFAEQRSRRRR